MAEDQQLRDLFGSDSEDEVQDKHQQSQGDDDIDKSNTQEDQLKDLFGSDDDEDERPLNAPAATGDGENSAEWKSSPRQSYQEYQEEPPLRGPPMTVEVPLHDVLASEPLRLAKLSNILSIEPRPFDAETHQLEEAEYIDERGHKRLRLRDANTIRWRWAPDADGTMIRQSNARLVQWSDGSTTLMVGDEVMDVKEIDVSGGQGFLFARHPNLIQGQGSLDKKIVFRPTSLKSGSHRRLAAAVDKHHSARTQRVRATATVVDPKKQKEEREKAEEARIRDKEKLVDRQQKQLRKYTHVPAAASYRHRALNAAYLEENEDLDEEDEDDGFIVRDEDMEEEEQDDDDSDNDDNNNIEEEGGEIEEEEARRVMDDEEDAEAARRLTAAQHEVPSAAHVARALEESEEEEGKEEGKKERKEEGVNGVDGVSGNIEKKDSEKGMDEEIPSKKRRAVLMESDSE